MASHANVKSLERVQQFLHELQAFRAEILKEIETLELELRKLTGWLEREAGEYWLSEASRAQHAFSEAQQALSRCMSYVREDERQPCTEQKKRVQMTRQRRETCEAKLHIARAAAGHWERERIKLRTKIERCRDLADSEILVAINQLKSQLERLEDYANLHSAANRPPASATQSPLTLDDQSPQQAPPTGQ
jgi:hypothetical protein